RAGELLNCPWLPAVASWLPERRSLPIRHGGEIVPPATTRSLAQLAADWRGGVVRPQPIDHRCIEDGRQSLIDPGASFGHVAKERHKTVEQVERSDTVQRRIQQRSGHVLL